MTDYRCDKFKSMPEPAWRMKHADHGHIVEEDYEGVQPPTYTLEQLRCTTCDAKLIRIRHRSAEVTPSNTQEEQ